MYHQVVGLEEEWGLYLCGKKEYETAIVHLIEAGYVHVHVAAVNEYS